MLTRRSIFIAGIAALGATTLGAAGLAGASKTTASVEACPGRIVCPLTGELVCRDQCTRLDATRADCPGRIECPLTGEPVCADRCPLEDHQEAPACCTDVNTQ